MKVVGEDFERDHSEAGTDSGRRAEPEMRAEAGMGVPCLEAQADGFPCPELMPDCADCAEEMARKERDGRAQLGAI